MENDSFDSSEFEYEGPDLVVATDPSVLLEREDLRKFFRQHRRRVFYMKQVEVLFEKMGQGEGATPSLFELNRPDGVLCGVDGC